MSLSCYCNEWDGEGWYFFDPDDFSTLETKRFRRCCSCGAKIAPGATVAKFQREREAVSDIERAVVGDEVSLAPWFMCEECAGLYFSLTELGFCINLGGDSMKELVAQYSEMQRARRAKP